MSCFTFKGLLSSRIRIRIVIKADVYIYRKVWWVFFYILYKDWLNYYEHTLSAHNKSRILVTHTLCSWIFFVPKLLSNEITSSSDPDYERWHKYQNEAVVPDMYVHTHQSWYHCVLSSSCTPSHNSFKGRCKQKAAKNINSHRVGNGDEKSTKNWLRPSKVWKPMSKSRGYFFSPLIAYDYTVCEFPIISAKCQVVIVHCLHLS